MSVSFAQPHALLFAMLAAVAVAGAVWFYRRVPPSASGRLRALLLGLRVAALLLLFGALIEPVVAIQRTSTEKPVVAVLVDASRSMSIRDGTAGQRRGDEAVGLLNEVVLPRIARDADLAAFSFATDVKSLDLRGREVSAPAFDGEATDIAAAFAEVGRALRTRNLGAVVIATDGVSNRGASPDAAAVALGVPVFALGVGDPDPATDIAIVDAITNRISYSGESLPIEVTVQSAGFPEAETVVELRENGVLLESKPIGLSGSGEETRLTFRVTPRDPGPHTYEVTIPDAPGELTSVNNTRLVRTTAMKGKIRVLLVGQTPSWDFAFLRRALESDRNMDATSVVASTGRSSAAAPVNAPKLPQSVSELLAYDLVIIVGADWEQLPISAEWLRAMVSERGGGLLLVGLPPGRESSSDRSLFPVTMIGPAPEAIRDARMRLTEEGETAPAMRLTSDRMANVELWRSLPPLKTAAAAYWRARPDATVLAAAEPEGESSVPVIVALREGAGTVVAVLADELWRWKMAGPTDPDAYDRLVSNLARFLTARGELNRVVVQADKDVYQTGEDVKISAQVYRGDYRLASGASVSVDVSAREGAVPVARLTLLPEGEYYRGSAGALGPGDYVARAAASIGGEDVGSAETTFAVEQFSLEDAETRRRSAVLRGIADQTGGGYYSPETLPQLPGDVPMAWVQREVTREFELWNSPWLLTGFVALMSVEWALRRRQGMP